MSKELTKKEYGISTLKGLIGAIPIAGTFLNEVAFEARSRIKQERVNSFITEFADFIDNHTDKQFDFSSTDAELLGNVFEEIVISASKTSASHKREIFKQILLNQLMPAKDETDDVIRQLKITNEISHIQFKILSAFSSLSDRMLKFKVQIIELEHELKQLQSRKAEIQKEIDFRIKQGESRDLANAWKKDDLIYIEERASQIDKLIGKKRIALYSGDMNPNVHKTFNLERFEFITEVQDLIAKGLLFDFINASSIINPNEFFGVTKLGRWYMQSIDLNPNENIQTEDNNSDSQD